MKNQAALILAAVAAALGLFALGFFVGRNSGHDSVITTRIVPVIETVHITAGTEAQPEETTLPPPTEPAYPININTADVQTLCYLPGIGEGYAQRIVDYRNENGAYMSVTDLLNVKGIGEKRLEEILPYITTGIEPDPTAPGGEKETEPTGG